MITVRKETCEVKDTDDIILNGSANFGNRFS